MKKSESGFTLIELIVAAAIASALVGTTGAMTWRIMTDTQRTNDHLTAANSAKAAVFWIGRDTAMADTVTTTSLISPELLVIRWTDWNYGTNSICNTVTYCVENTTGGIGTLKRFYERSTGENSTLRIADHIYYNANDTAGTTITSFGDKVLSLKVVSRYGTAQEITESKTYPRPNFLIR